MGLAVATLSAPQGGWTMRSATLVMTLLLLGGCSGVAAVWDPRTGQTDTCSGFLDWGPWSQRDACIAEHVAQGWRVKMRE